MHWIYRLPWVVIISIILILPIQAHDMSFYLFVSYLISFISVLGFSEYRSFVSSSSFIPKYFILFDVMVNGIGSLISLSDLLLVVYRNARDSCVLILYPVTLPNSLMSSSSFLVAFLGFYTYSMSPASSDSFTSYFLIWIPGISFSSPIAVARTSKTMLSCQVRLDRSRLVF